MKLFIILLIAAVTWSARAKTITLTTKNSINFIGPVTKSLVDHALLDLIMSDLARPNCSHPLYLVIDSPGGSIDQGNRFLRVAKTVCNLHTITLFSASMASAIAMQISGKRYTTETSEFMFHRARAQMQGQIESGEFESRLIQVKRMVRHLERHNARRIGISYKMYKRKVKDEWWLFGAGAVRANVADEVVQVRCSKKLVKTKEKRNIPALFGVRTEKKSKCPLL